MSLQVWLPLNGNLNNQGASSVTVTNSGATVDSSGKIGQCYYFNGNNSWIKISMPSSITSIKNTSICAWVKSTGSIVALGGISNNTGVTNATVTLFTSGWQFSGESGYKYISGGSIANTSVWHHVCCTIDDTTITTYLDGTKVTSNTLSGLGVAVTTINSNNFIEIGCDHPGGDEFLTGYVNDFRIYNHALSPKEVKEISKALILHYPLDGNGRGGDNIVPNTFIEERSYTYPSSGISDKWAATTSIIPSASQYVLSFYAKSTVNGDKARAHWYSPNTTTRCESSQGIVNTNSDGNIDISLSTEWKKYWVIYTQSETTAVKHLIFPRLVSGNGTGTVSVKQIKLEEGTIPTPWCPNSADVAYTTLGYNSTTEIDTSGYKHNGTRSGSLTISSDTPRYSVATHFTNANSTYITIPAMTLDLTKISISTWFRISSAQVWQRISDLGEKTEGKGYSLLLTLGNDGKTLTVAGRGANGASLPDTTIQAILLNTWYHVVTTIDETTCKTYVNGVLVKTFTLNQAFSIATPMNLNYLGKSNWSADKYFDGDLSDFRLYATALSADDIKELYQSSAFVTNNGSIMCYDFIEQ